MRKTVLHRKNLIVIFTKGTQIFVYFILANIVNDPQTDTFTQCNFTLDGQPVGNLRHPPEITHDLFYGYLAYTSSKLPQGPHTLVILPYPWGSPRGAVYMNFDYAIYT